MQDNGIAKRDIKDSVFRKLFSDSEYLLQLYQTLHPEDKETKEEDLQIVTLQSILVNGLYNDIGFLAKDRLMILAEAQSTWSPNIIIRGMMYLMSTYQEYFHSKKTFLYGSRAIHMPKPELYVIYTQEKKGHPDILSFKETYFSGQECCIDAWAKVIYLDDSDSIINQYIKFCLVHTRQAKIYGYTLTAIKNTIRICKEQNLLRKFLESREMEVEDIMLTLFNQSHVTDTYGLYMMSQGEALGEARGEARGELRGEEKIVRNMLLAGMEAKAIAEVTKLPIERIEKILQFGMS